MYAPENETINARESAAQMLLKIEIIQDDRNLWVVAIERQGRLLAYFTSNSMHGAYNFLTVMKRDLKRHGIEIVDFENLKVITERSAKSGKTIYHIEE